MTAAMLEASCKVMRRNSSSAKRPYEVAMKCWDKGFYVRYGGDTIQLAPPFIMEKHQIDSLVQALGEALQETH